MSHQQATVGSGEQEAPCRVPGGADDIDTQGRLEITSSEDEDSVEALTPKCADEPLGECIREWRLDRGADEP